MKDRADAAVDDLVGAYDARAVDVREPLMPCGMPLKMPSPR